MHPYVTVLIPRGRGEKEIGRYYSLVSALADVRSFWLEYDPGLYSNLYICREEGSDEWLAVLGRHRDDPTVCITSYPDATSEVHSISLVAEGRSVRVVVEPLDAPRKMPSLTEFAA